MSFACNHCAKIFASAVFLGNHNRRFEGRSDSTMPDEELSLFSPSTVDQWKVWCSRCRKDVAERYVVEHVDKRHSDYNGCIKSRHVYSDMKRAKQAKDLDDRSVFQIQWEAKQNSLDASQFYEAADTPLVLQDALELLALEDVPVEVQDPWEGVDVQPEHHGERPAPQDIRIEQAQTGEFDVAARDGQITQCIEASESRSKGHMSTIVESFNEILKVGLCEVQAKYEVALMDTCRIYTKERHGPKFPKNLMASKYDLESFKVTVFELRGLSAKHAENTNRDMMRFLGSFASSDAAGEDLTNLLVNVFKHCLIKQLLISAFWQSKRNYFSSLKTSLGHFESFLEKEQRQLRAFGGLTTALANVQKARLSMCVCVCF